MFLACYLGVAYITHATQGFYTYNFLDPRVEHGLLAAYIVGILAIAIVIFVLVRYILLFRAYLTIRLAPGKRQQNSIRETKSRYSGLLWMREADTERAEVEALDEWEEIQRPSERHSGSVTGIAM